jgi:hypothetical protein
MERSAHKKKRNKSRPRKEPKDPRIAEIYKLRDGLQSTPEEKEASGLLCKGMYQCSKKDDQKCLDRIKSDLTAMVKKKGGGKKRSTSKRSRSRSKSRRRK